LNPKGETIVTEMWKVSPTQIVFQCKVAERPDAGLVLSNCVAELNPSTSTDPTAAISRVSTTVKGNL